LLTLRARTTNSNKLETLAMTWEASIHNVLLAKPRMSSVSTTDLVSFLIPENLVAFDIHS